MATRKEAAPRAPAKPERWRLVVRGDVVQVAVPVFAYRVLFSDGHVLNVEAVQDSSFMREAVLHHRRTPDVAIVGVAQLGCVGWTVEGGHG